MAIKYLDAKRIRGVLGENKVANFDGTGDYVTVDSLFSGTDPWSFSIWVYHTGGTSGNDGIIGAGSAEQLLYQGSSQKFGVKMGTGSHIYTAVTVAENTWYHLAGTRGSTGGVVFYLNGASSNTVSDAGSLPTGDWQIGYTAGSEYWQGSLAEYAVWDDRELTLAEVQAIYNSGSPTRLSDVTLNVSGANYSTDLIGYYPMGTNFNNAYSAGGGTNGVVSGDATADNSSPASPISDTDDKATLLDWFQDYLSETVTHTSQLDESANKYGIELNSTNPLLGEELLSFTMTLRIRGSPTGNLYAKKYNSSGTLQATSTNYFDISTLPPEDGTSGNGAFGARTWTFAAGQTLADGDRIVFEGGSHDGSNQITFQRNSTAFTDTVDIAVYTSSWSTNSGSPIYKLSTTGAGLPENTLFEETDTRRVYWLQSSKWGLMPSWSDYQTTDKGWTVGNAANSVDTTNNKIIVNHQTPIWISTGVDMLSSENFVLDFEVNFNTLSSGSRQDAMLFSSSSAQQLGGNPTNASWFILVKLNDNNPNGFANGMRTDISGTTTESNASEVARPTADTWYWYRSIRNGTTFTTARYTTEANRTNGVADVTATTSSLPTNWDNTDTIKYFNFGGYASAGADYDVRNIKFYRGVTSV